MAEENLDDLPPEERIKKLKELEKKRKQEIEEAQKKIKQSEEELTEKGKWVEKVPIPQVAHEDLKDLTAEEKEVLEAHKGRKEEEKPEGTKEEDEPEAVEEILERKLPEEISLEALATEGVELPPEIMQSQYTMRLSERPVDETQKEVMDIYQTVKEKGYMTQEEERKIQYDLASLEKKRQSGYSFTEKAVHAASAIQQTGAKLLYKSVQDKYKT